jgi:hypothetical protein
MSNARNVFSIKLVNVQQGKVIYYYKNANEKLM